MAHEHTLTFKFSSYHRIWILLQPHDQDVFLYPNGTIISGYSGYPQEGEIIKVNLKFDDTEEYSTQ